MVPLWTDFPGWFVWSRLKSRRREVCLGLLPKLRQFKLKILIQNDVVWFCVWTLLYELYLAYISSASACKLISTHQAALTYSYLVKSFNHIFLYTTWPSNKTCLVLERQNKKKRFFQSQGCRLLLSQNLLPIQQQLWKVKNELGVLTHLMHFRKWTFSKVH